MTPHQHEEDRPAWLREHGAWTRLNKRRVAKIHEQGYWDERGQWKVFEAAKAEDPAWLKEQRAWIRLNQRRLAAINQGVPVERLPRGVPLVGKPVKFLDLTAARERFAPRAKPSAMEEYQQCVKAEKRLHQMEWLMAIGKTAIIFAVVMAAVALAKWMGGGL